MPLSTPASNQLAVLIKQKERELQELSEARQKTAEDDRAKVERQRSELQTKYDRLRADFDFNLRLIEERDAELNKYDLLAEHYKSTLSERDKTIADLKIQCADAESKSKQLEAHASETELVHAKQIATLQNDVCRTGG